ncbi:MAG: 30S ribosomal protein S4 [Ruminococcaceae bacterium]|jgi:small subunit ribosomal protein S4|nr:30S ribosomal protein S4 [Oscillospiraceae bacterium]MBQ9969230.1 30S ribosomal protein S4 [Oscillospiraceae bacterium]
MARYTGAVCKLCRREGQKLFLKGERCYSDKCALARRAYAPGQHGQNRKKVSEYGIQLRAKQKTKRFYGVLEGQFAHYFELATKMDGQAGENLLKLLESRLDNVVYRMGLATSRAEARQMVRHGHFTLNGHKANIPSILLKAGDVIEAKGTDKVKAMAEINASKPVAKWLEINKETLVGKVIELPSREDIDLDVEEHLIVELYSK